MSDLAKKIQARLDESERLARAAAHDSRAEDWEAGSEHSETVTAADGGYILCAPYDGILDWDLRRFLVAHDPASVLRRCAADREIIQHYRNLIDTYRGLKSLGDVLNRPSRDLPALEARIADHAAVILPALARGYGVTDE